MSHQLTRRYHPIPKGAILVPVPDVSQLTDYSCGSSSLQSICKYYGVGPDDEDQFTRDINYDHRVGSNPGQLIRAAKKYGLKCREYFPMTDAQLRNELGLRHPVMIMIQAWTKEHVHGRMHWKRSYKNDWKDGHWIVAIGFDEKGFFFEDPSLQAIRGYISTRELKTRWRDTGKHGVHMPHYGVSMWKPGVRGSMYEKRAEYIE